MNLKLTINDERFKKCLIEKFIDAFNVHYIFGAIEGIANDFFASNAKESYEYCYDTYGNYSTHVDGEKVGISEEEPENE